MSDGINIESGWVAAALLAAWSIILRVMLGRYYKSQDEIKTELVALRLEMALMNQRLARLEGRFSERDHLSSTYP